MVYNENQRTVSHIDLGMSRKQYDDEFYRVIRAVLKVRIA